MKKIVFVAALLLMLSLSACAHQDTKPNSTDSADDLQAESITMLDAGVWPVNEYTQGLPIPSGTVAWAMLDTEHGNCSISIADVTERDFADYRACLEQAGFFALEHAAEEIKGQSYISIGTLLSNGDKTLSLSYIPDQLTIYISFENKPCSKRQAQTDFRMLRPLLPVLPFLHRSFLFRAACAMMDAK